MVQALAGLTALTRLYLKSNAQSGLVPRCEELACLHSSSLRDLTVFLSQVPVYDKVLKQGQEQGLLHCLATKKQAARFLDHTA